MIDKLKVANKRFNSRLIVGTGKYKNMSECAKAIKLSGADIVTVAVRRVNISDKSKPLLMDYIDPKKNYIFTKHSRMFLLQKMP
jgi:thiazole synthase